MATDPEPKATAERLVARTLAMLADRRSDDCPASYLPRLRRFASDLVEPLVTLYGQHADFDSLIDRLAVSMFEGQCGRSEELRQLDSEREANPDWFQRPEQLGYVCYVDRFAQDLKGVAERLDYLEELRITYLHLMPFFERRAGDNDGGYAIRDHRQIEPSLGDMQALEELARQMRARRMSLCVDLVLNHVAREHAWAESARRADAKYQDYFWIFADRCQPDQYEQSLPEVFPAAAPGSFSYDESLNAWVWTTFHDYQWDLNWHNPNVFLEFVDLILYLANRGAEVFRLDAVAFIWKRLGTDCQNQPEVHRLVQALRAVARIVTPAVAFKAEAIVGPEHLINYLGRGEHTGKVSDLAYQNSAMAHLWSALAARDARLMQRSIGCMPSNPTTTSWATYLRCHDDIGWAITDEEAGAFGFDGPAHRRFLVDYYKGDFPGSPARGQTFQNNPATGDRRSCGTTASLVGLEHALQVDDPEAISQSIERLLLGHAVIFALGGLPLIYMGDEIGMLNDWGYRLVPGRQEDSRWLHRPAMDWNAARHRGEATSVQGRIYRGLSQLIEARRRTPQFHARVLLRVVDHTTNAVLAFERLHEAGRLLCLFNFSEIEQAVEVAESNYRDCITGDVLSVSAGAMTLPPYGRRWLICTPAGTGRSRDH